MGFSLPSGSATVTAGKATTIQIGVAPAGSEATTVHWQAAVAPGGPTPSPSSGTLTVAPASGDAGQCGTPRPATAVISLTAPARSTGSYPLRLNLSTADGIALPPVVVDVEVQP